MRQYAANMHHCACYFLQATAGLAPDGRMLANRAMEEASAYRRCVYVLTVQMPQLIFHTLERVLLHNPHINTLAGMMLCPRFYGDSIPGHVLAERIASYMHLYNLYWSVRWVNQPAPSQTVPIRCAAILAWAGAPVNR